jgi:MFS family permease
VAGERRLAFGCCAVLVLGLAGLMTFQALIPDLMTLWRLSAAEAGWLAGAGFLANALLAPVLVTLTDRVDARRVVLAGLALSALAGAGFALAAQGYWSALAWRVLGGIGLAATYMPGLKALADRLRGPTQGRLQGLYTASYSLGAALSLFAAGLMAQLAGWQAAFLLSSLMPALAIPLLLGILRPVGPGRPTVGQRLFDPRPVLRDRAGLAHILAYAGHCFELFGFRTWLVAFLTFAGTLQAEPPGSAAPAALAAAMLLLGLPASLLGNELASRHERRRVLVVLMLLSAAVGLVFGLAAQLGFWLLVGVAAVYAGLMMADSAGLTVGLVALTPAARRGLTIGVQQLLGAGAAVIAPLLSGMALDGLGAGEVAGWWAAYAVLAAGALLGALALAVGGRRAARSSQT